MRLWKILICPIASLFLCRTFHGKNHPIQRPACLGSSLDQLKIWVLMRRRTDLGWRYMAMWSTWKWELMDGWMNGRNCWNHTKIAVLYIDVVCETKIWEFYGCYYWKSTLLSWFKYLLTTTSWYLPKLWVPVDFVSPKVTLQISPVKLALSGKSSEGECFGPHIPTYPNNLSFWRICLDQPHIHCVAMKTRNRPQ